MKATSHIKSLLGLLLLSFSSIAQNLVPNYSFEDTLSCDLPIISNAPPWYNPTGTSPDYWNADAMLPLYRVPYNGFGYQPAKTGQAYAGLATAFFDTSPTNAREYIETPLDSPLVAGKKYCVQFYVNLADSSEYATDGIGAYLSVDSVQDLNTTVNLPYVPQIANPDGNILTDHINWILISGEYTAIGGERFITIGNFKNDADSQTQQVNSSSFWAGWCYYFIEDVYVGVCNTIPTITICSVTAPNIFTPNNDDVNDVFKITSKNIATLNCKIYNRWGILVSELTKTNEVWDGRSTSGLQCVAGIYYYILKALGEDGNEYDEKGAVSLIR